jgi:hypothetical protein
MEQLKRYTSELHNTLDLLPIELIGELISILQDARVNQRQVFHYG